MVNCLLFLRFTTSWTIFRFFPIYFMCSMRFQSPAWVSLLSYSEILDGALHGINLQTFWRQEASWNAACSMCTADLNYVPCLRTWLCTWPVDKDLVELGMVQCVPLTYFFHIWTCHTRDDFSSSDTSQLWCWSSLCSSFMSSSLQAILFSPLNLNTIGPEYVVGWDFSLWMRWRRAVWVSPERIRILPVV